MNRRHDGRVTADELRALLAALRQAPPQFARTVGIGVGLENVEPPLAPDTWSGLSSLEARRITRDALERFAPRRSKRRAA